MFFAWSLFYLFARKEREETSHKAVCVYVSVQREGEFNHLLQTALDSIINTTCERKREKGLTVILFANSLCVCMCIPENLLLAGVVLFISFPFLYLHFNSSDFKSVSLSLSFFPLHTDTPVQCARAPPQQQQRHTLRNNISKLMLCSLAREKLIQITRFSLTGGIITTTST